MNDLLLLIMSIIGFLALYWALIGQWKYNKMMKSDDQKRLEMEVKRAIEKNKLKKKGRIRKKENAIKKEKIMNKDKQDMDK